MPVYCYFFFISISSLLYLIDMYQHYVVFYLPIPKYYYILLTFTFVPRLLNVCVFFFFFWGLSCCQDFSVHFFVYYKSIKVTIVHSIHIKPRQLSSLYMHLWPWIMSHSRVTAWAVFCLFKAGFLKIKWWRNVLYKIWQFCLQGPCCNCMA